MSESLSQLKKPLTLFLIGAFFLCFHMGEIVARLSLSVNGKIISVEKGHYPNTPARKFTIYQIQDQMTGKMSSYRAEGNDHSLSGDLKVGSIVEKRERTLTYFVDQKKVNDFPWQVYFAFVFLEACLIAFAGYRQIQLMKTRKTAN